MITYFSSFFLINLIVIFIFGINSFSSGKIKKITLLLFISLLPYSIFTIINFFKDQQVVNIGISRAAFLGVNPTSVVSMLLLCIVILGLMVTIVNLISRRFGKPIFFSFASNEKLSQTKSNRSLELICIFLLAILSVIPLLKLRLNVTRSWTADLLGWDVQNFDTWNGLFLSGNVPMRDFWYPYGNLIILHAYPIRGALFSLALNLLFLLYIRYISDLLYSKTFSKISIYVIFFLILLNLSASNNVLAIPRYGLFPLSLIYSTLLILRKNEFRIHNLILVIPPIIFSIYYSVLYLLLITFAIILCLLILIRKREFSSSILRDFVSNKYVMSIFIVGASNMIYGIIKGNFNQEVRLILESQKYSQGLSFPMNMQEKFLEDPISYSLMVMTFFIFLGLLILNFMNLKFLSSNDISISISIMVGLIYMYLSLQKYSVRGPTYDTWLVAICLLSVYILADCKVDYKIKGSKFLWPIGLGLTVFLFMLMIPLSKIFHNYSSILSLVKHEKQLMISRYSDTDNYGVKPEWVSTINFFKSKSTKRFFTLTDNGYLYLATNQLPYFHIAAHNMSNRIDDLDLLKKLRNDPPDYLVIDLHTLNFEQVNSSIRLPKTVQFLSINYQYVESFNDIFIFQKNKNVALMRDSKFHSIFSEINLGQIPFRTNLYFSSECLEKFQNCQEYLRFRLRPELQPQECWLEFNVEGRVIRYTLNSESLKVRSSEFAYFSLSNSWFYPSRFKNNIKSNCFSSYSKVYANSSSIY